MAETEDKGTIEVPLLDASDSDVNRLVDEALSTGKHLTLPATPETAAPERYHARAIAEQMQRLAQQLRDSGPTSIGHDDRDVWWFEVEGKRIGPLSMHKIRLLWDDGEITPDSLCWHEGFPSWVSLFKVSELAEALVPKLKVNVDAAAAAFEKASSGEWASPAATAMQAANRKRLASTQKRTAPTEALPLSTPLNLADERAATYTALATDVDDRSEPSRGGFRSTLVSGLIAGVIASGTLIVARVWWPVSVPPPIVIAVPQGAAAPVAAPLPAPAPTPTPVPAAPSVVPAVAVAPRPAAVPAMALGAKPQPAPVTPAPAEPKKPATVEEAFAKAFADAQPDELQLSEVMQVVLQHKAEADACAAEQRAAAPDSSGKLVVRWTVEPAGHVTDIVVPDGEMAKSPMAECLAKAIAAWKFPKHALAHPPVEFPFKY